MISDIYIRPLREEDSQISYRWRNDPEVWEYTGSKPDKEITLDIEKEWVKSVLPRTGEKRFAICLKVTDEYIGNVQLTGINSYEAEFHIFIGEKKYWGKGFGTIATKLIVEYAFEELKLQCVYLLVKKQNAAAIRSYEKAGFHKVIETDDYLRLAKYSADLDGTKMVSVFMMAYNHGQFISRAIEGILIQKTNFNLEIVIGEDKSTDNTIDIILNYAQKYPNKFKLILHEKNIGAGLNQVAVLNTCSGKYIAFCEGDDYWTDPLKLQKQVDFLEANPDFAICFHRVKIVYEEESREILSNKNQKEISEFEDLALKNYIHTPSCVFRNGLFKGFPDWFYQSPVGDWVLHLLNAQHGKIKFLEDVMAVYRIHNNGVWSMKDPIETSVKWIELVEQCRQYFYPRASNIFMQNIANKYEYMSFSYFERNDFKNFRKYYRHYLEGGKHANARTTLVLKLRYLLSFSPFAAIRYNKITQKLKLDSSV